MSERALEFVETWVSEKIEEMGDPPQADSAKIDTMAAECIQAAQAEGIPQSEISDAFDDLAAFIAGQIQEIQDRDTRPDEGANLVDDDDSRVIDEEEDEAADDDEGA